MSEFHSLDPSSSSSSSIPVSNNVIMSDLGELQEVEVSDELPDDMESDVDVMETASGCHLHL